MKFLTSSLENCDIDQYDGLFILVLRLSQIERAPLKTSQRGKQM